MKIEKKDINIIKKESAFYNDLTESQKTNYHRQVEIQYSMIDYKEHSNKDNIIYCIAIIESDISNKDELIEQWEL